MKIKVKGFSIYSDILGELRELDLEGDITIGDLLSKILPEGVESEYGLVVFVNGKPSRLDYKIKEGDLLEIAPSFSGG
ncbi:MAG: MoaD/ThiS family protein [Fervidicoccus sp.]|nr:MAG: MoaD/ThiS family protein [Fervidicoccus sp.]